jgi:hypothetical protein
MSDLGEGELSALDEGDRPITDRRIANKLGVTCQHEETSA